MTEDKSLDVERLHKITSDIISAITSPPFVEAMRTMKSTPENERLKVGAEILNPAALRSKGVPLPADMRITSRYFESGKPTIEVADPHEAGHPPIVNALPDLKSAHFAQGTQAGVCACGGAATVCGGAGN